MIREHGIRCAGLIVTAAVTAGCGLLGPRLPDTVEYTCDHGKGFKVAYAASGDSAIIEINRMAFGLRREPGSGRYTCDVLTLSLEEERAVVVIDGVRGAYANCRVAP